MHVSLQREMESMLCNTQMYTYEYVKVLGNHKAVKLIYSTANKFNTSSNCNSATITGAFEFEVKLVQCRL